MYWWKTQRQQRLVGNTVWVMRIQRPCTCFWWGFLHVRPHQRTTASFIMQNSSTPLSKDLIHGQVGPGFFILCLIICILDKSYFYALSLFLCSPFQCTLCIFLSLSTDFRPFPFFLGHLYSFYNCSFVWKGLRLGIKEPRLHRDKRMGQAVELGLLHITKGHWRKSLQRYLDSGCLATHPLAVLAELSNYACGCGCQEAVRRWIEAAICCWASVLTKPKRLRPWTNGSAPASSSFHSASLDDLSPFSCMSDLCSTCLWISKQDRSFS